MASYIPPPPLNQDASFFLNPSVALQLPSPTLLPPFSLVVEKVAFIAPNNPAPKGEEIVKYGRADVHRHLRCDLLPCFYLWCVDDLLGCYRCLHPWYITDHGLRMSPLRGRNAASSLRVPIPPLRLSHLRTFQGPYSGDILHLCSFLTGVALSFRVSLPPYVLLRDDPRPRNSSLPEAFWPDRWLVASGQLALADTDVPGPLPSPNSNFEPDKFHLDFVHAQDAFVRLSAGPMNCVGKNLTLVEMRILVCVLLQWFACRLKEGWDVREYEGGYMDLKSRLGCARHCLSCFRGDGLRLDNLVVAR